MAQDAKEIEQYLSVGAAVLFHTDPNRKDSPRFKTFFRGWRKGSHLMLDRPKAPNGAFVALQEGQPCGIRFLREGEACAFDAQVIDWDTRRFNPYVRISWPREVDHVCFRKFERVKISVPCIVRLEGNQHRGDIRDMSIGGCAIVTRDEFEREAVLSLDFELPDGTKMSGVEAVVRGVRECPEGHFLGCQFVEDQPAVESDLAFFVTMVLGREQNDAAQTGGRRILVADDNPKMSSRMKRSFEREGFEVVLAGNLVDAMYRLRMAQPRVVAVSEAFADLPGVALCRVLKNNRDFHDMPVYVFGGSDGALPSQAEEAGATGYYAASVSLAPDMAREISQALKQGSI